MKVTIMVEDIPEESVFYKESGRNSLCIEYHDVNHESLIIGNTTTKNNITTIVPDFHVGINFDVCPNSGLDYDARYTMIIPRETNDTK